MGFQVLHQSMGIESYLPLLQGGDVNSSDIIGLPNERGSKTWR